MQGFITDHETALEELFSEDAEKSRKFEVCLNTMATRIATVFASLKVWIYKKLVKNYDTTKWKYGQTCKVQMSHVVSAVYSVYDFKA